MKLKSINPISMTLIAMHYILGPAGAKKYVFEFSKHGVKISFNIEMLSSISIIHIHCWCFKVYTGGDYTDTLACQELLRASKFATDDCW